MSDNAEDTTELLTAALLWFRNHYDVNAFDAINKELVITTIDRVLLQYEPTMEGQMRFRKAFLEKDTMGKLAR